MAKDFRHNVAPAALDQITRESPSPDCDPTIVAARGTLKDLLLRLEPLVVPEKVDVITKLGEEFDRFAVQVSLVGQVKAGKTALANALLGQRTLLPSDINPWTSVVTSIHVNRPVPRNKHAVFRFFTEDEWDAMVTTGGRIATIAAEADLDAEVEDLQAQILNMQKKTEARLGKNFQLLLGNQHAFSEVSSDLVRRYVCLGDENSDEDREGRFADMTRSADIYLKSRLFDYATTIVDTPGVNDPFLVREAMTLESLGDADICVIVLSAHQALSTSDLALMRILMNLKHRQIVLFINRVDELADPTSHIPEIRARIEGTLFDQGLPTDIPVVFGSAAWADAHLAGTSSDLPPASAAALETYAAQSAGLTDLSGMSELQAVLDKKATRDIIRPFFQEVADVASAAALQSKSLLERAIDGDQAPKKTISRNEIDKTFEALRTLITTRLDAVGEELSKSLQVEFAGHFSQYIFDESRKLNRHLDNRGKTSDWTFDTHVLRATLKSSYTEHSLTLHGAITTLVRDVYQAVSTAYASCDIEEPQELGLIAPTIAEPAPPVALMRTMSIDVSSHWLMGWMTRNVRRQSFLKKFRDSTMAQLSETVGEIDRTGLKNVLGDAANTLEDFLESHHFALTELIGMDEESLRTAFRQKNEQGASIETRLARICGILEELDTVATRLKAA